MQRIQGRVGTRKRAGVRYGHPAPSQPSLVPIRPQPFTLVYTSAPHHHAHQPCLRWVVALASTSVTQIDERQAEQASTSSQATGQKTGTDTGTTSEWELEMEELFKLVSLLPANVRNLLIEHPQMPTLLEVVMDLGRPPLARFPEGDVKLGDGLVSAQDLEEAIAQVGEFGGDNRAGIDRTLHRISCIRNRSGRIIGLTCRVGRAIRGSAHLVADLALSGASILFLGRPGVGKTTAIREVSRLLADELQKRVVIVDTSNEIGGDGDIPHEGIGRSRRLQVPHPEQQHRVMIEAVENHMPEVVVIDEIGTEAECAAARTIAQRGVQLVATAHGNEIENVVKNPSLADLVGGIQSVTLGDEEARKRGVQKSILERAAPPTFDVAVEMLDRHKWRVHLDVAQAVDLLLAGGVPGGQVRERAEDGTITRYTHDPALSFSGSSRPARDFSNNNSNNGQSNGSNSSGGANTVKAAKAAAAAALMAQEAAAVAAATSSGISRNIRSASGTVNTPRSQHSGAYLSNGSDTEQGSSNGSVDNDDDTAQSQAEEASSIPSGSFMKRNVLGSLEAAGDAADSALGDDGVPAQKGAKRLASRQALLGVAPEEVVLRLFPYELDVDKLWEVMSAMELTRKVLIVRRVSQADAVLGVRARVKTDAALRQAAKASRVPIYAIKATGTANLVRALRTLMGVDPSAGGVFLRSSSQSAASDAGQQPEEEEGASSSGSSSSATSATSSSTSTIECHIQDSAGQPMVAGSIRAEIDIASIKEQQRVNQGDGHESRGAKASVVRQALQEAHAACEQIVKPLQQPVELMPRPDSIIQSQIEVVEEYNLGYEVLGMGAESRLRILPR